VRQRAAEGENAVVAGEVVAPDRVWVTDGAVMRGVEEKALRRPRPAQGTGFRHEFRACPLTTSAAAD